MKSFASGKVLVALVRVVLGLAVWVHLGGSGSAQDVDSIVGRINSMRAAVSASPLALDARLTAAAASHAADMAARDSVDHVSPTLGDPSARVRAAGMTDALDIGENVALGASLAAAHDALVASDAHRANLLNTAFTHIGIAAVDGPRGVYVVEMFARLTPVASAVEMPPPAVAAAPADAAAAANSASPATPAAASPTASEPSAEPAQQAAAAAPAVAPQPAAAQTVTTGASGASGAIGVVPNNTPGRRTLGYWVNSQGRWWYYALPANARPGDRLVPTTPPVGAAPPGHVVYPSYARPPVVRSGPAPFGGWSPRRYPQ